MKFLNNLRKIFTPRSDDRNYWFFVKCDHCGEILKGRIDLHNHLSIQYGAGRKGHNYFCRKVLIGSSRCYRQIETEFTFDKTRKLLDQQIKGGKFMTEEDFITQD